VEQASSTYTLRVPYQYMVYKLYLLTYLLKVICVFFDSINVGKLKGVRLLNYGTGYYVTRTLRKACLGGLAQCAFYSNSYRHSSHSRGSAAGIAEFCVNMDSVCVF